jgi:hypothetical protein
VTRLKADTSRVEVQAPLDDSIQPIRLQPGDRVLIALHQATVPRAQQMKDQLEQRFPGVEFTLLAGATAVAVQPAEHP